MIVAAGKATNGGDIVIVGLTEADLAELRKGPDQDEAGRAGMGLSIAGRFSRQERSGHAGYAVASGQPRRKGFYVLADSGRRGLIDWPELALELEVHE